MTREHLATMTFKGFVEIDLQILRGFINKVESYLTGELEDNLNEIIREIRSEESNQGDLIEKIKKEKKEFEDRLNESGIFDIRKLIYKEISLFRNSMHVTCFNFFETWLLELCEIVDANKDNTLNYDNIPNYKGRGFDKKKKYLKYLLKTNFPDNITSWQNINRYYKIRNAIVHNDGIINEKDTKNRDLIRFINNNKPNIRFDWDNSVIIERQFIDKMIIDMEDFLDEFIEVFDEWIKEQNIKSNPPESHN